MLNPQAMESTAPEIQPPTESTSPRYEIGEKVNIIVVAATPLGFKVLINDTDDGILYGNEVFEELRAGQHTVAYVKKIRDDQKIDLIMQPLGSFGMDQLGEKIMKLLTAKAGFLPVHDKTPAEKIYDLFGVSKKKYKMALGGLYRKRLITISDEGIRLAEKVEAKPDQTASTRRLSSAAPAIAAVPPSSGTPSKSAVHQPQRRSVAQPIFKPSRASKLFGTSGPSKK